MDIPSPLLIAVVLYAAVNLLAFLVFAGDKLRAKAGSRRRSERLLLFISLFGPFGALLAMMGFRHKTRHVKFLLVLVFAILHLLLIILTARAAGRQ